PAYSGSSDAERLDRARRGDLADALARLDACGADPELVALAKDCLAPERADRPADAGVVAALVAAHRAAVAERLRAAELARVAAGSAHAGPAAVAGAAALAAEVDRAADRVAAEAAEARRDRDLVEALADVRSAADEVGSAGTAEAYGRVLRGYGLDPAAGPAA